MIRAASVALTGMALLLMALPANALGPPPEDPFALSDEDDAMAFAAAGFHRQSDGWHNCDDPGTPSYTPGQIDSVDDLNGDGQPEAVISEGGSFCYGNTGTQYWLVSRNSQGAWKLIDSNQGIPVFLKTRGVDNWPDIEVGGPGFCFPVLRWDGKAYQFNRKEYDGKPC